MLFSVCFIMSYVLCCVMLCCMCYAMLSSMCCVMIRVCAVHGSEVCMLLCLSRGSVGWQRRLATDCTQLSQWSPEREREREREEEPALGWIQLGPGSLAISSVAFNPGPVSWPHRQPWWRHHHQYLHTICTLSTHYLNTVYTYLHTIYSLSTYYFNLVPRVLVLVSIMLLSLIISTSYQENVP